MSFTSNWNYPTPIKFGPGRIRELAQHCTAAGITRPLLVTDAGLARLPMVAEALDGLKAAAGAAGVPLALVGQFGGGNVAFGADAAPMADLSALYRGAFAAALGL